MVYVSGRAERCRNCGEDQEEHLNGECPVEEPPIPLDEMISENVPKKVISFDKDEQVNHPAHYTRGGVETIDVIKAKLTPEGFRGYLQGCIIKYTTRFELKGRPVQDLKKARWYLNYLIKIYEE